MEADIVDTLAEMATALEALDKLDDAREESIVKLILCVDGLARAVKIILDRVESIEAALSEHLV